VAAAALLVWNGTVNRRRTTEVLEQFKARGVGGVFVHPRCGLVTEYLSKEYLDQWEWTLQECRRLGWSVTFTTRTPGLPARPADW